jgi:Zn finger protein HypA/HybF involved in hydrogenase expression
MLGLTWKCKNCNHEVIVTDGWEFYLDKSQKRQRYSSPVPILSQSIAEVEGFSSDLYCPQCQDVRDVVVEDFRSAVTIGRQDAGKAETQPVCDICGTMVKRSLDADRCPKCNTGTFRLHNIWES